MFTGPYSYHLFFCLPQEGPGAGFCSREAHMCTPKLNSPLLPDPQGPAYCLTFLPPLFAGQFSFLVKASLIWYFPRDCGWGGWTLHFIAKKSCLSVLNTSNFIPFFSPVPVWLRLQLARGSPHCPHSMSVWSPYLVQDYRSLCLFLEDKLDIQTQHYKLCNFKYRLWFEGRLYITYFSS